MTDQINTSEMAALRSKVKRSLHASATGSFFESVSGFKEHFSILKDFIKEGMRSNFFDYISMQKLNVVSVKNFDEENLLHAGIQSCNELFVSELIDLAEAQSPQSVDDWLNSRMGRNGLTPLHIAAYKGKPRIIRLLVEKGAEITLNSKYGMNVVHFAAQNNQPWPIAYFHEVHGFSLNERDEDGNTPLHWACHFGSATAAEFILKWAPDSLNEKNNLGHTPLHLAVESSIASESIRLVRILLFSGADRGATDKTGRKPIDIVQNAQTDRKYASENMKELKKVLMEPKEYACLMLKIPVKKLYPDRTLVVCFVVLHFLAHFICCTVATQRILLYVSNVGMGQPLIHLAAMLLLYLLSMLLFIKATTMDPGFYFKKSKRTLTVLRPSHKIIGNNGKANGF